MIEQPRITALLRPRKDSGARPIAKEDAGVAVGVINKPRQRLGPENEYVLTYPFSTQASTPGASID